MKSPGTKHKENLKDEGFIEKVLDNSPNNMLQVRHRAARVHDWALNHIKMDQARKKSNIDNRKKQL